MVIVGGPLFLSSPNTWPFLVLKKIWEKYFGDLGVGIQPEVEP
jgi:hypothetical protein